MINNENMNINETKKNNFFISQKKIHFIGVGGAGMGGLALILLKLGHTITGSDLLKNSNTKKLINKGAIIYFQHSKKNIYNIDYVVKSSAIKETNQELIAAKKKKKKIPIFLRAEMLALLMQFKFGIAISGTHGKTTTTSMIFDIFKNSKLSPTCINGGLIKSIQSYSHLGVSQYFIVEADESDASLLFLKPSISIVTNIESDHMDYYNGDFEKLKNTFFVFLKQIPHSGTAILCIDNRILFDFSSTLTCNVITYGFHKNADVRITKYKQNGFFSYFVLVIQNKLRLKITLNMPGKHNALNAAAAVALAMSQGIKNDDIIKTLKYFQGTERRFDLIGKLLFQKNHVYKRNIMLIDDYGHHPTALSENIKTIRISWPKKKLIMIFQPHRYTRTHYLYNDFVDVLSQVDVLLILNVYSANEKYISGANSFSLYHDIKKSTNLNNAVLISNHNLILDTLTEFLQNNDIVLLQGAGNIKNIIYKMLSKKNIKLNK